MIHLLCQHLLAQNHRQKHKMSVNNKKTRTKVNDIILLPLRLTLKNFTLCSSVFSVSVFDFEQVKSRLNSKSQRSKRRWYSSFILCKKHWFTVVRGELTTCDTFKAVLFYGNSLQFFCEIVTILTRSSIFRSFIWCWICLGVFFQIYIYYRPFSSPNIFKY